MVKYGITKSHLLLIQLAHFLTLQIVKKKNGDKRMRSNLSNLVKLGSPEQSIHVMGRPDDGQIIDRF